MREIKQRNIPPHECVEIARQLVGEGHNIVDATMMAQLFNAGYPMRYALQIVKHSTWVASILADKEKRAAKTRTNAQT